MRKLLPLFLAAVLGVSLAAQEPPLIEIEIEPLGDAAEGVAARVTFRFDPDLAGTPEIPQFLQGSFLADGKVIRNFRYRIRTEDNGSVRAIQVFPAGPIEVDVRIVSIVDELAPTIAAKASRTADIAPAGKPYVADMEEGAESVLAEGVIPETVGAVKILPPRRDVAPNLFIVEVAVQPPVTRVEFYVNGKRILARNAAPWRAELDLGKLPKRVEVRVIGYDVRGRYVDADAFLVNERDSQLEAHITRTVTPDGVNHFRISVQNPTGRRLGPVVLQAGDRKLHEWTRPPYAIDLPASALAGHEFVSVSVTDDSGYEASDLLFLSGDRYLERIDVNLVELPVTVSDRDGTPITDLTAADFTIIQDGRPQTITSFNFASNLPLSVGVLIDYSGSMEKRLDDAREAAVSFLRSIMRKDDKAFVSAFAAEPSRVAPFMSSVALLEAQVNAMPEAGGWTALYDALVTGLYRFRNVQGRKALIVITDGEDTGSRLSWDDMLAYARSTRVPLYFIGIGMRFGGLGGSPMRTLAAETGGVAYFVGDTKGLPATWEKLERELRSQYILGYQTESSSKEETYRAIEVKVNRPGAQVRTIRGFIL